MRCERVWSQCLRKRKAKFATSRGRCAPGHQWAGGINYPDALRLTIPRQGLPPQPRNAVDRLMGCRSSSLPRLHQSRGRRWRRIKAKSLCDLCSRYLGPAILPPTLANPLPGLSTLIQKIRGFKKHGPSCQCAECADLVDSTTWIVTTCAISHWRGQPTLCANSVCWPALLPIRPRIPLASYFGSPWFPNLRFPRFLPRAALDGDLPR